MLTVPRLVGDGVVLRPFRADDAPLVQEASSDPLVPLITTVPTVDSTAEATAYLHRQHERARTGAGYSFCVALAGSDEPVGQIGLWPAAQDRGRASVGYWLLRRVRGTGLAVPALGTLSDWGLSLPESARLELYVEPWNVASWRTAERAGYQREGLLRQWQEIAGIRRDMYVYSRVRGDAGRR